MGETGSWWRDPVGWGLALWGAAVAVLAFPPGSIWPLALVAPAPLWGVCLGASAQRAFARGWLYGFGFFVGLLWWIAPTVVRYGGLPAPVGGACVAALSAYLALYPALGGAAIAAIARRRPALALAQAPFAWTGLEGLRGIVLTGFPWGDLPQAVWQVDPFLAAAPWVGIDGVRLIVAGVASAAAWLLARAGVGRRARPWALIPCAMAVAAGGLWYALPPPLPAPAGEVEVAVVQANIDQAQKWDPEYRAAAMEIHSALSRSVVTADTELLLWPETAVPFSAQDPSSERKQLESLAQELRTHVAFGAPAFEYGASGIQFRNAFFLLDPEGHLRGRYDKVHLVPFGEYVPLGRYLPFVKKLAAGAGDFTAGPKVEPLQGGAGLPVLGPLVCFEVIFPEISAAHVREGAQILAVVTNDGWFGKTPGPHQHLGFAAWRAAEQGVPLVRAANTGVSAVFNARGRLLHSTALLSRDAFATSVAFRPPHRTPQHRLRPWITPGCLALAGFAHFAMLWGRRNRQCC